MVIRSTNPYTRIEQDIKVKSESILDEVKLPSVRPVDISTLSEAEFPLRIDCFFYTQPK